MPEVKRRCRVFQSLSAPLRAGHETSGPLFSVVTARQLRMERATQASTMPRMRSSRSTQITPLLTPHEGGRDSRPPSSAVFLSPFSLAGERSCYTLPWQRLGTGCGAHLAIDAFELGLHGIERHEQRVGDRLAGPGSCQGFQHDLLVLAEVHEDEAFRIDRCLSGEHRLVGRLQVTLSELEEAFRDPRVRS